MRAILYRRPSVATLPTFFFFFLHLFDVNVLQKGTSLAMRYMAPSCRRCGFMAGDVAGYIAGYFAGDVCHVVSPAICSYIAYVGW